MLNLRGMKLRKLNTNLFCTAGTIILVGLFVFLTVAKVSNTHASGDSENAQHFVTIHDGENSLTIKTNADTVGEALKRAKIDLNEKDLVDPEKDVKIDSNNFHIDLYRARPVIVTDGKTKKYLMSANYDKELLVTEAGFEIDGNDEIRTVQDNHGILETGLAETYRIYRNNEPVAEEKYMKKSSKKLELKTISEPTKEPEKDSAVATNFSSFSTNPDEATCKAWIRAAGVSSKDLEVAYWLITKESHCRYNATNRSSGAYGIPQALPGKKMASAGSDWQTNPITQIKWMISYVNERYGGWSGAKSFWDSHRWY